MTVKGNNNIIKIQVTTDLEIEFDFSKKHLFVYSNIWKTKNLKVQEQKQELPSNKKVRPSKAESQFDKFIQTFTLLQQMDTFNEGVSFQTIREAATTKGIAKDIRELDNLINDAISKDIIESADKFGVYKLKT